MIKQRYFFNIPQIRHLFVNFIPFLETTSNEVENLTIKSIDGVLGIRTRTAGG